MINYEKPYPTIGDLIKNKNYDYVSYRMTIPDKDMYSEFCGCFAVKDGEIIPLDGDCYYYSEGVIASEEWENIEEGIKNGLTVVVEGEWIEG